MPLHDTQECERGENGLEHKFSHALPDPHRHSIPEASCGEGNEIVCHEKKVESPTAGAESDFPSENGSLGEHAFEQRLAAAGLAEGDEEYGGAWGSGISAVGTSKARHLLEAESATPSPPPEAGEAHPPPEDRHPAGDGYVKTGREKLNTLMPADQGATPKEAEHKSNHATGSGVPGQIQGVSDEPKAAEPKTYNGEGQEAAEGGTAHAGNEEYRGADATPKGNESRAAAVVGNGADDEVSEDAVSFVKEDDVSGSDDEFGKGVAKHCGEQQQRQQHQQRQSQRRQSGERENGEQSNIEQGNDEVYHGESVSYPTMHSNVCSFLYCVLLEVLCAVPAPPNVKNGLYLEREI